MLRGPQMLLDGTREVVIVGARRTGVGAFRGGLATIRAPQLGALCIKALLKDANLDPSAVDEVGHRGGYETLWVELDPRLRRTCTHGRCMCHTAYATGGDWAGAVGGGGTEPGEASGAGRRLAHHLPCIHHQQGAWSLALHQGGIRLAAASGVG